jgi:hypothetical protein
MKLRGEKDHAVPNRETFASCPESPEDNGTRDWPLGHQAAFSHRTTVRAELVEA